MCSRSIDQRTCKICLLSISASAYRYVLTYINGLHTDSDRDSSGTHLLLLTPCNYHMLFPFQGHTCGPHPPHRPWTPQPLRAVPRTLFLGSNFPSAALTPHRAHRMRWTAFPRLRRSGLLVFPPASQHRAADSCPRTQLLVAPFRVTRRTGFPLRE